MVISNNNQDSFISDDEEELCPLCVEEMDISDKNFKPCPCGYQVCQFCYNNIRSNLNGKCPACRRPYSDENVEYKVISQEEWKQDHLRQARKERERKQKEREKKEVDVAPKKHLSGMRVIQKNLVYVIGLNPNIPTEELHNTLRGDQFFGQYGKIQKIVINKRTNANGNPGLGVYVTFARKEDAARCIAAVDGSINDGKYLRAAYGTTKYCSSYLRGQPCPNPNCMFLHEPGEEADSYTRQDLSTIQHAARQGLPSSNTAVKATRIKSSGTPVSAHSMPAPVAPAANTASHSEDDHHSETGSALPPSVSWAQKASPPTVNQQLHVSLSQPQAPQGAESTSADATSPVDRAATFINESIKNLSDGSFAFVFNSPVLSDKDMSLKKSPTLFAFSKDNLSKETKSQVLDFNSLLAHFNNQYGALGDKKIPAFGIEYPDPSPESVHAAPVQPERQLHQKPPSGPLPVQGQLNVESDLSKTPTPPPGLFTGGMALPVQNQNSHELLAHLMNGNRATDNKQTPNQELITDLVKSGKDSNKSNDAGSANNKYGKSIDSQDVENEHLDDDVAQSLDTIMESFVEQTEKLDWDWDDSVPRAITEPGISLLPGSNPVPTNSWSYSPFATFYTQMVGTAPFDPILQLPFNPALAPPVAHPPGLAGPPIPLPPHLTDPSIAYASPIYSTLPAADEHTEDEKLLLSMLKGATLSTAVSERGNGQVSSKGNVPTQEDAFTKEETPSKVDVPQSRDTFIDATEPPISIQKKSETISESSTKSSPELSTPSPPAKTIATLEAKSEPKLSRRQRKKLEEQSQREESMKALEEIATLDRSRILAGSSHREKSQGVQEDQVETPDYSAKAKKLFKKIDKEEKLSTPSKSMQTSSPFKVEEKEMPKAPVKSDDERTEASKKSAPSLALPDNRENVNPDAASTNGKDKFKSKVSGNDLFVDSPTSATKVVKKSKITLLKRPAGDGDSQPPKIEGLDLPSVTSRGARSVSTAQPASSKVPNDGSYEEPVKSAISPSKELRTADEANGIEKTEQKDYGKDLRLGNVQSKVDKSDRTEPPKTEPEKIKLEKVRSEKAKSEEVEAAELRVQKLEVEKNEIEGSTVETEKSRTRKSKLEQSKPQVLKHATSELKFDTTNTLRKGLESGMGQSNSEKMDDRPKETRQTAYTQSRDRGTDSQSQRQESAAKDCMKPTKQIMPNMTELTDSKTVASQAKGEVSENRTESHLPRNESKTLTGSSGISDDVILISSNVNGKAAASSQDAQVYVPSRALAEIDRKESTEKKAVDVKKQSNKVLPKSTSKESQDSNTGLGAPVSKDAKPASSEVIQISQNKNGKGKQLSVKEASGKQQYSTPAKEVSSAVSVKSTTSKEFQNSGGISNKQFVQNILSKFMTSPVTRKALALVDGETMEGLVDRLTKGLDEIDNLSVEELNDRVMAFVANGDKLPPGFRQLGKELIEASFDVGLSGPSTTKLHEVVQQQQPQGKITGYDLAKWKARAPGFWVAKIPDSSSEASKAELAKARQYFSTYPSKRFVTFRGTDEDRAVHTAPRELRTTLELNKQRDFSIREADMLRDALFRLNKCDIEKLMANEPLLSYHCHLVA